MVTDAPDRSLTVILNGYRRHEYIQKQLNCINEQDFKPERVLIWNNGVPLSVDNYNGSNVALVNSSYNFGVWARFALALNSETDYVCLLDDDVFPGQGFFSTCASLIEKSDNIIGSRGLIFHSNTTYSPFDVYGWDSPNEEPVQVDILGHAWFIKREWLTAFWRELRPTGNSIFVGEDIHLSYTLRKYLNIGSVVSPHPIANRRIWSNTPELARAVGGDIHAISQQPDAYRKFDAVYRYYVRLGLHCSPTRVSEGKTITRPKRKMVLPIRRFYWLVDVARRYSAVARIARALRSLAEFLGIRI